jgi:isochorismate synthase/2-succinyl-5-enolpyruvyl-6-hydroxy-3-cyclohexene-1-carboxylate synthase/2-succinyl-6-hydroxy-2,4-cyclohexadiene-1-carboxylate synthase/O-succinylbenzoate synthase
MTELCWSLSVISHFYYQLDHATELSHSLIESANINAVWASLLVEECARLGLTVRW